MFTEEIKILRIIERTLKGIDKQELRVEVPRDSTDSDINETFEILAPLFNVTKDTNIRDSTYVSYEIIHIKKCNVLRSFLPCNLEKFKK